MREKKFWVLKQLNFAGEAYVIYREDGSEILVEVKNGSKIYKGAVLTPAENHYFNTKILTKVKQDDIL